MIDGAEPLAIIRSLQKDRPEPGRVIRGTGGDRAPGETHSGRKGAPAGLADTRNVAVIRSAAAAQHVDLRVALQQLAILRAQLNRIAVGFSCVS